MTEGGSGQPQGRSLALAGPERVLGGAGAQRDRESRPFNDPPPPKRAFWVKDRPPGTGKRPRLVSQWLVCEKFGLGTIEGLLHRIDGEIVRKAVPVTTVVVGPSPVKLEAGSSDGSSQPKSKGIEIRISLTPKSVAI